MRHILAFSILATLFSCTDPASNKMVGKVSPETIREYEYSYSGTMMWYITWHRIEKGEDGHLRLLHSSGCEPDITIYRCPDDALAKIDGMVRKYKLWRLENSYSPKLQILDGHMWHTYIGYDRASISTGGSNAWPGGKLAAGLSAIESYVQSIIDSSTEADIIGTDTHANR
ncbi:MAG: hypothetical protein IJ840_04970 [Bacteroidales bacterium]|nr:hypothetical protein [Bacteroidales bacterium]